MDDSDSGEFATRLAIVGLLFGVGAFFLTFLQTLMEYLSSSQSRSKCARAAIGPWHSFVKWRWSFTDWKLKVYFPVLHLTAQDIISRYLDETVGEHKSTGNWSFSEELAHKLNKGTMKLSPPRDGGWDIHWVMRNDKVGWLDAGDDYEVLKFKNDFTKVRMWDFRRRDWIKFIWYRLRHPKQDLGTLRASWALILVAARITSATSTFVVNQLDADTIPSQLDIPMQTIKLFDAGVMAFFLGMSSVGIDITQRTLEAAGETGSITTEHIQSVGKVLRFDGDLLLLHRKMHDPLPESNYRSYFRILGRLDFGPFLANRLLVPLGHLRKAIMSQQTKTLANAQAELDGAITKLNQDWNPPFTNGCILREALNMRSLLFERARQVTPDSSDLATNWRYLHDSARLDVLVTENMTFVDTTNVANTVTVTGADAFGAVLRKWETSPDHPTVPTLYAAALFQSFHGNALGFPVSQLLKPFLPWVKEKAGSLSLKLGSDPDKIGWHEITGYGLLHRLKSHNIDSREGWYENKVYGWGFTFGEKQLGIFSTSKVPLFVGCRELLKTFDICQWSDKVKASLMGIGSEHGAIQFLEAQLVLIDIFIKGLINDTRTTDDRAIGTVSPEEVNGISDELVHKMEKTPRPRFAEAVKDAIDLAGKTRRRLDETRADPRLSEVENSNQDFARGRFVKTRQQMASGLSQVSPPEDPSPACWRQPTEWLRNWPTSRHTNSTLSSIKDAEMKLDRFKTYPDEEGHELETVEEISTAEIEDVKRELQRLRTRLQEVLPLDDDDEIREIDKTITEMENVIEGLTTSVTTPNTAQKLSAAVSVRVAIKELQVATRIHRNHVKNRTYDEGKALLAFLEDLTRASWKVEKLIMHMERSIGKHPGRNRREEWNDERKSTRRMELAFRERWGENEAKVVAAIVKAWEEKGKWDKLPEYLLESGIPGLSSDNSQDKAKELAFCLEIRAVFVFAHLYLHPDSSDVYNISESEVELPMV